MTSAARVAVKRVISIVLPANLGLGLGLLRLLLLSSSACASDLSSQKGWYRPVCNSHRLAHADMKDESHRESLSLVMWVRGVIEQLSRR